MQAGAAPDPRRPAAVAAQAPISRWLLLVLALATLCSGVAIRLCDGMLPALAAEFGSDIHGASVAITAFALGYGLFQLVSGSIAEIGRGHV